MNEIPLTAYSPLLHAAAGVANRLTHPENWEAHAAFMNEILTDIYTKPVVLKRGIEVRDAIGRGEVPANLQTDPLTACMLLIVLAVNGNKVKESTFELAMSNILVVMMKDSGLAERDFLTLIDAEIAGQVYASH